VDRVGADVDGGDAQAKPLVFEVFTSVSAFSAAV
jgi:hypothetical protein